MSNLIVTLGNSSYLNGHQLSDIEVEKLKKNEEEILKLEEELRQYNLKKDGYTVWQHKDYEKIIREAFKELDSTLCPKEEFINQSAEITDYTDFE